MKIEFFSEFLPDGVEFHLEDPKLLKKNNGCIEDYQNKIITDKSIRNVKKK